MIFAETERLLLRTLEGHDLPRLCELAGDWDVAKWLSTMPHPYKQSDGEWFLSAMQEKYKINKPEFYALCLKEDNLFIGGLGFRHLKIPNVKSDELSLGYWLGRPYWGRGIMAEAISTGLGLAFNQLGANLVISFTHPDNKASQSVLRKTGFKYLGIRPRIEEDVLRSTPEISYWEFSKADYQAPVVVP